MSTSTVYTWKNYLSDLFFVMKHNALPVPEQEHKNQVNDWVLNKNFDLKEKSSIGFLMSLVIAGVNEGSLVVMRIGRMLWFTRLFTAP
jgi:hypothetical protein